MDILRHVFAIRLGNLCDSWKALRKVKEEERRASELGRKRKSVPDNVCQSQ